MQVFTANYTFTLDPNETLLEGLERTGHEVEYQCRSGYCGMCRLKLLSGEVDYPELPLAFVAHDEVLPCCSVPLGDIKLDCRRADLDAQGDLFVPDLLTDL